MDEVTDIPPSRDRDPARRGLHDVRARFEAIIAGDTPQLDVSAYLLHPPPSAAELARRERRRTWVRYGSLLGAGIVVVLLLAPVPGRSAGGARDEPAASEGSLTEAASAESDAVIDPGPGTDPVPNAANEEQPAAAVRVDRATPSPQARVTAGPDTGRAASTPSRRPAPATTTSAPPRATSRAPGAFPAATAPRPSTPPTTSSSPPRPAQASDMPEASPRPAAPPKQSSAQTASNSGATMVASDDHSQLASG